MSVLLAGAVEQKGEIQKKEGTKMPYTDRYGNQRFSDREQYHHYKKIADEAKAPARTLRDGTKLPAKNLTRTEVVRYANKAEAARQRLNEFMKTKAPTQPTPPAPKPAGRRTRAA